MSQIFGAEDSSSDENDNFKLNNEYAKKYDDWRKKEELNKLKTKYGEDVLDEDSTSSSDDDEAVEITEDVEKDFFRTLARLKNKDPSIYKKDVNFFGKSNEETKVKKKKKDKPVFLKDYERNLILEKGGVLSDEEDENDRPRSPTYNEEQKHLKNSFKKLIEDIDDEHDENWGGIFKQRQKTKGEVEKEDTEYKEWLIGQKNKLEDENIAKDLKPLKEYWNKPDLDSGEKFLRDYILKKKYLDTENEDYIPTYDEIIHDSDQDLSNDEDNIEKQEEFEHKYNFRYEEPDQEFIKRYPRTMENSLRKTDDRRKVKRQEIKERKKKEKEEKMKEVKKMQELKLKEIEEKLEKLKEITGNPSLGFANEDLDGDFDPEEHDKKMQALFNDDFYTAPEDEQKPEFPDLDEELEIENWERYTGDNEKEEPHCEDEDFNMDCDYDPEAARNNADDEMRGRKKRRKKSKFAAAVSKPKPKYDPTDKRFEKYFDEYYQLDCEDIIGDTPCRFKYRKVAPNDFGLSTEEILLANERELNKWCSLKKAVQIRSDEVEKYDQIAYKKKGQNINLKQKILPSLFTATPEESTEQKRIQNDNKSTNNNTNKFEIERIEDEEHITNETKTIQNDNNSSKSGKKKKNKQKKPNNVQNSTIQNNELEKSKLSDNNDIEVKSSIKKGKKKLLKSKQSTDSTSNIKETEISEESVKSEKVATDQNVSINKTNKQKKKKKKRKNIDVTNNNSSTNNTDIVSGDKVVNKKRKNSESQGSENKRKKQKFSHEKNKGLSISDARLSAYGINPKKFKNKLKYKK